MIADTELLRAVTGVDDQTSAALPAAEVLKTVDAAELIAQPYRDPEFLVDSIIPKTGTVLLTGDTGSCKTAFLFHTALCIATNRLVAGRFAVVYDDRPVLIIQGEMGGDLVKSYLHQAAAGLGVTIPANRIYFEGAPTGTATFRFADCRAALESLFSAITPSIVLFDTQRALFGIDENDSKAVREACSWLQGVSERFDLVCVLSHHLRKLTQGGSNSDRERVAGSRDWIAAVDVHLAAKAVSGKPMHALALAKTRTPTRDAIPGTEWPIETRLDMTGDAPRSLIVAGDPAGLPETQPSSDIEAEIRARFEVDGPMTLKDLGARSGNVKRVCEQMRASGDVIEIGKRKNATLWGLAGVHEPAAPAITRVKKATPVRPRSRKT